MNIEIFILHLHIHAYIFIFYSHIYTDPGGLNPLPDNATISQAGLANGKQISRFLKLTMRIDILIFTCTSIYICIYLYIYVFIYMYIYYDF
jgi:hypothetical protein